ncbi:MAG: UPF0280 family protein [Bacteroidales bacterium]|nr:UPF0280 family protein [Bacteroidales bacterium]
MAKSPSYQPRLYREAMGNKRWISFRSAFRETDLWVAIDRDHYRKEAERFTIDRILYFRKILDKHIAAHPEFRDSLTPVVAPGGSHPLITAMSEAALAAGTGPMSAVAGAMAEFICNDILEKYRPQEIVIENGGDLFMKLTSPATIAVYAGSSPLSGKVGLKINPEDTPLSVCCSSGTVGHSLSFGIADACMTACGSGALADAYATSFCNEVKNIAMVHEVTEKALKNPELLSVIIIAGDSLGIGGKLEIKVL